MKSILQNHKITWLVAILNLVFILLRFIFENNARVTFDSGRYAEQAYDLPCVLNDIGPLGYPLFIRLLHEVGFTWFWAGKIPSLLSYIGIIWLSYKKKFYFVETLIVLSFVSFISIFSANWSEPIYLFFLYLFLYVLHKFLHDKSSSKEFIIQSAILFFVLFQIRYVGLFISVSAVGLGMFYAIFLRKNILFPKIKSIAISGIFALLGILLLQLYVKSIIPKSEVVGNFYESNPIQVTKEMILSTILDFNPWFPRVVDTNLITILVSYGIGLFFLILIIWFRKAIFKSQFSQIAILLTFPCILVTYASRYFYSLNPPDYRMLGPYLFVIFLLSAHCFFHKINRWIFVIPLLSYVFCLIFFYVSKENFIPNYKKFNEFAQKHKSDEMLFVNKQEFETKDSFQQKVYLLKTHFPKIKEVENTDSIPKNLLITENTIEKLHLAY